nr:MAG TPA: hypothetical protein [Inoviridae sp.]
MFYYSLSVCHEERLVCLPCLCVKICLKCRYILHDEVV